MRKRKINYKKRRVEANPGHTFKEIELSYPSGIFRRLRIGREFELKDRLRKSEEVSITPKTESLKKSPVEVKLKALQLSSDSNEIIKKAIQKITKPSERELEKLLSSLKKEEYIIRPPYLLIQQTVSQEDCEPKEEWFIELI